MNCIIIDDEPLARQGMDLLIKSMPQLTLMESFSNALEANVYLQQHNVDLIFLDINMPEINGLDFAKSLSNAPLIIFTTAYPQYALDSYELHALDYLLKPIRLERFISAVNKAQNYLQLLQAKDVEPNKVDAIHEDYIYIKSDRKYFKVFYDTITHIEGLKDYVIIHQQGKKILTAMNLKTVMDYLSNHIFARISKSFIVNTTKIISCDTYNVNIDNVELPIGNTFKDDFFARFIDGKLAGRD
jgi:two-component system, LytTR family, response regulator